MAIDEAILESVLAGNAPPTLRLYAWAPPCLSLGHAQPGDIVDEGSLASEGWGLVRRPTGGRALLHADELTYAVVATESLDGFGGGVLAAYRHLSRGLLAALERLGVRPDAPVAATPTATELGNPVCFEVPSAYEITVGGRKLMGSAQLRRRRGVLQHGSLPLFGDITRVVRALRFPDEVARRRAAERLRRHATTLEEQTGQVVAWSEAAAAFREGFTAALGWSLAEGSLTEAERALVEELGRAGDRPAGRPAQPAIANGQRSP
jgi:lipoate-protein ligase A